MAEELAGVTSLLYELGLLKRYKRTGWLVAGVQNPESIAEHSFRTAIIAAVLASMEGGSPERAAFLGLLHDTQETRVTDIPYIGKRYLKAAPNEAVTADQVRSIPQRVAEALTGGVREYEAKESLEAACARDADKLECLLQALEYRDQGNKNMQGWIDSSLAALSTATAKELADQALRTGTLDWLAKALQDGQSQAP
ncbi:HD family hydrolase [Nonomuraea endophytica]|uniref:HD family hydrolase n=1 Tax=Nonomuraea endophytica TaxID=714136 RepID=UPI0037C702BA